MVEVMAGIVVHGQELEAPPGISLVSHVRGTSSLRNCARRTPEVTEVVVHETVTQSAAATVAVLQQRGLGVHFIVGYDGTVYQHADLLDDETWHASEHNPMSVGIEVVNPFEKQYLPHLNPVWVNELDVPWASSTYVVPTPEQSEATCLLLQWLMSPSSGLSIPHTGVGLDGTVLRMGRLPESELGPGIYAHRYFADHQDGSWPVLYAWLRIEAGLTPEYAYAEALRRAAGVDAVDLSDLVAGGSLLST
jgi:hypothetical protein